jgi:hypothetical protein
MSSSTNTACKSRRALREVLAALLAAVCLTTLVLAQDVGLRAPSTTVAGTATSVATTGSGSATFYLVGPSVTVKRDVHLGDDVALSAKDLQSAGKYLAIVCGSNCRSVEFFVAPSKPVSLTFLMHPSRAPVGLNDVVSGVALPFDEFRNLIFAPVTVDFQLSTKGTAPITHPISTQNGVAWFRANSGRTAGALQITASIINNNNNNEVVARRIVQQVAADPCSLRIKGQRTAKGIVVETEPVRDCAGNPVPDGTVVTFTAKDGTETSTVDAPVKQGIARAQMMATGPVLVSAASGVVMGNELRLGAQ